MSLVYNAQRTELLTLFDKDFPTAFGWHSPALNSIVLLLLLCRDIHRLSSHEIALVGTQIADALSYIHKNNLVVLGMNPQNILIQMDKTEGIPVVKLTDVSLAQCSKLGEEFEVGPIVGARGFVAPEVRLTSGNVGDSST